MKEVGNERRKKKWKERGRGKKVERVREGGWEGGKEGRKEGRRQISSQMQLRYLCIPKGRQL